MPTMLPLGEMATDFILPDQHDRAVCLYEELVQDSVVVTFYSKDATFG